MRVFLLDDPTVLFTVDELGEIGVLFEKYPTENFQIDRFKELFHRMGYTYSDIVEISREMQNYQEKLVMFFEEHLHLDDEIRFFIDGSGYFDVRDKSDRWIRICGEKGDLITLVRELATEVHPAGIYHRFSPDSNNWARVMRLFKGEPVWTAYNRRDENVDSLPVRRKYLSEVVNGQGYESI